MPPSCHVEGRYGNQVLPLWDKAVSLQTVFSDPQLSCKSFWLGLGKPSQTLTLKLDMGTYLTSHWRAGNQATLNTTFYTLRCYNKSKVVSVEEDMGKLEPSKVTEDKV